MSTTSAQSPEGTFSPLPDRKRQPEYRHLEVAAPVPVKRSTSAFPGRVYSGIGIHGNARAQLGDHYGHIHVSGDYYEAPRVLLAERPKDKADALIKWLQFPRQDARRQQIHPAHQETFEWIYQQEESKKGQAASGFARWLRQENGLYFIHGKPGCGKSTLMKLLSSDPRTRDFLTEWSGGESIILLSFFFWGTGTTMQKSTLGLLRSLLCDLLKASPSLADVAFPDWSSQSRDMEPTTEEVKEALKTCMESVTRKVCLLIDGLDEFDGRGIDKADLATSIADMVTRPGIKAVVSSRQLRVFEDIFSPWPCLAVQDFTADDVWALVSDRMAASQSLSHLSASEPEAVEGLARTIAERASGVFLYAVWAVNIVSDGCRNGDHVRELRKKVSELPSELESLFRAMLDRVEPAYRRDAFRFLSIVQIWEEAFMGGDQIETLSLGLAADVESVLADFWEEYLPLPLEDYVKRYEQRIKARLQVATQGLLEDRHGSVVFMHKSVGDFLMNGDTKLWMDTWMEQRDQGFHPAFASLLGHAMRTRLEAKQAGRIKEFTFQVFFGAVWLAEKSTALAQTPIVDRVREDMLRLPFLWIAGADQTFMKAAVQSGCELYLKERLSDEGAGLLQKHPSLLFDAVYSHLTERPDLLRNDSPARIVKLLLRYGASPHSMHQAHTAAPITRYIGLEQRLIYPWEAAAQRIHHYYDMSPTYPLLRPQLEAFEALDIMDALIDYATTLRGSATVSEIIREELNLPHEATLSTALHVVLGKECLNCGRRDGRPPAKSISGCSCDFAQQSRQKIFAIQKKLVDRVKLSAWQARREQHEQDRASGCSRAMAEPADTLLVHKGGVSAIAHSGAEYGMAFSVTADGLGPSHQGREFWTGSMEADRQQYHCLACSKKFIEGLEGWDFTRRVVGSELGAGGAADMAEGKTAGAHLARSVGISQAEESSRRDGPMGIMDHRPKLDDQFDTGFRLHDMTRGIHTNVKEYMTADDRRAKQELRRRRQ